MERTVRNSLHVSGARLAYEVRGSGPLLLMIAGGNGSSSAFAGIASLLVDHYTVVTYDRRGSGESVVEDPLADRSIERHSDDAVALLRALTTEPAYVFGSSAGGLVALDLVTRYAELVRLLVAHEPTVPGVLPAFDESQRQHLQTFREAGAVAAISEMTAANGGNDDEWEPGVVLPPADMEAAAANAQTLFTHTVLAILRYRLDVPAMASVAKKVALAAGRIGRERQALVYQCTVALAQRLSTSVIEFPGNHTGCISRPRAFARRLREALLMEPGSIVNSSGEV